MVHHSAGCISGTVSCSDAERACSHEVFLLLMIARGVKHFRQSEKCVSCRSVLYSPGAKWVKIPDGVVANCRAGKKPNKSETV